MLFILIFFFVVVILLMMFNICLWLKFMLSKSVIMCSSGIVSDVCIAFVGGGGGGEDLIGVYVGYVVG